MLKIEKGIKIPEVNPKKNYKYPWTDMEVGDSFLVNFIDILRVRIAAHYHSKTSGRKYTTRIVDNGARVWRTE